MDDVLATVEAYVTDGPARHGWRSRERWGAARADTYITGLFQAFGRIAGGGVPSRPVPAAFGVDGYVFRYERHFVYWKTLNNGNIGIVTVLHERMHQMDRFREDFGA